MDYFPKISEFVAVLLFFDYIVASKIDSVKNGEDLKQLTPTFIYLRSPYW